MKSAILSFIGLGALALTSCGSKAQAETAQDAVAADTVAAAEVYYIKDITPENLVKIYNALGRKAEGDKVAVKISTGESERSHHLDTGLIAPLVREVKGTLVECNTAYEGNRNTTERHRKTAADHGYTAIAEVDIMDADGSVKLPVEGGKHLAYDLVGKSYPDYDFTVVLSHFKGHAMGGFGGALKNISIGIASSAGKTWIHTAGKTDDPAIIWKNTAEQDDFLESMGDACKAIVDHAGDKILYINVANNLSVDCDCDGNPHKPEMANLGIFASLDPVALDRACYDMVVTSTDPGKDALIERMDSRHATHLLDYSEQLGIGTQNYRIIELK